MQGVTSITATILDANDKVPTFVVDSYSFSIPEESNLNTIIGTVSATDADIGANKKLSYAIVKGNKGEIQ